MKTNAIGCDVGNNSVKLKTSKGDYRIDTLVRQATEARIIFGRGDSSPLPVEMGRAREGKNDTKSMICVI